MIYGDEFGERFIGNLINYSSFCEACGIFCEHCRTAYPSFSADIEGVFQVEANLPAFIDDPETYLPQSLGSADLLVAIGIHVDLLLGIPKLVESSRVKGVIVPIEHKDWCPPAVRSQLREELGRLGVETAFPKPFCALEKTGGKIIDAFVDRYMVGRPMLEVELERDIIREVRVLRSAPCGSTWYIAQQIRRKPIEGLEDVISRAHHSYPCTASMEVDRELGDTILHKAGYIIREEVFKAVERARTAAARL